MKTELRFAIVGSGPAGMYALEHLIHNNQFDVQVDVFERLPVPYGLVRFGVAPDHPEKKLITGRLFSQLISKPNVNFFGNVEVGKDISLNELQAHYHGVIIASGATSDRKMGIPGESLKGNWSAREFVAWYNGHPDYSDLTFDLSCDRAVIVGNGNVALDVARVLTLPMSEIKKTDIATHAIDALSKSNIKEVVVLGRRGFQFGAYNNPELEEFLHMDTVQVSVEDPDFDRLSDSDLAKLDWETKRKVNTLKQLVSKTVSDPQKRVIFKFQHSPIALNGEDKVMQLVLKNNGAVNQQTNPSETTLNTGLVISAIGYQSEPFGSLPFNEQQHVINHQHGRIVDQHQAPLPGMYVTGWTKRGPKGVIGTNKRCAGETVDCIMADYHAGLFSTKETASMVSKLQQKNIRFVSWRDWLKIDYVEKVNGAKQQRPREKLIDVGAMLSAVEAGEHNA